MPSKPTSFSELFRFYHEYVKLLYSSVQVENVLPLEILFELNAALDHISRKWAYGETEEQVVQKAYAHFKRSCLDVFKIRLKTALDQYERLLEIDTSVIDNGEYDRRLHQLVYDIRTQAAEARRREGDTRNDDDAVAAFDLWEPVFNNCVQLEKDFFLNTHLDWARKRQQQYSRKAFVVSVVASFVAGVIMTIAVWLWQKMSS